MTKNEILEKLKEAIYKVQKHSDEEFIEIEEDNCPIDSLPGFDSLRGVEVTVELCDLLDCELHGEANIFISEDGKKALTLKEVADRVCGLYQKEGGLIND